MCKHERTTAKRGMLMLESGSPIAIHQCDMCGALVWRIDTSKIEEDLLTLPMVDAIALANQLQKSWEEIMAQPRPTAKKSTPIDHDRIPIKAKDVKREPDGDALWA